MPLSTARRLQAILDQARRLSEPPVPGVLVNSADSRSRVALRDDRAGLARRSRPSRRPSPTPRRSARSPGELPLCRRSCKGSVSWHFPGWRGWRRRLLVDLGRLAAACASPSARIATELDPSRNPWIMMSSCVALSLVPRFLEFLAHGRHRRDPSVDQVEARRVTRRSSPAPLAPGRRGSAVPLRASSLVRRGASWSWSLAATNLTPALLFEPWTDGRTIAPAVVHLAAGPADARSQAAALALCAIAINLAALAVARASSALPRAR